MLISTRGEGYQRFVTSSGYVEQLYRAPLGSWERGWPYQALSWEQDDFFIRAMNEHTTITHDLMQKEKQDHFSSPNRHALYGADEATVIGEWLYTRIFGEEG